MSALRIAVLAAALPFALVAMDDEGPGVDHHLRISGHLLPDAYRTEGLVDEDGENDDERGEFKRFSRIQLGYLASIPFNNDAAFLAGVNVMQSTFKFDGIDPKQFGGGIELGVAATPAPYLAFEFTAQGGMGELDSDDAEGHYGEFGLTFRPVVRLAVVELFAELGHLWQKMKIDGEGEPDYDIRVTGARFGLGAGVVF